MFLEIWTYWILSCYNNPSGYMEDTRQMQTDETLASYHNQDKRNTKYTKQIILLVCGPFDAGDWWLVVEENSAERSLWAANDCLNDSIRVMMAPWSPG